MLSKEEVENMKLFFNESIKKDNINSKILAIDFMTIALAYIEQLETKNQKLIEKLEEDIENFAKENRDGSLQDYVDEILEILKGENDE